MPSMHEASHLRQAGGHGVEGAEWRACGALQAAQGARRGVFAIVFVFVFVAFVVFVVVVFVVVVVVVVVVSAAAAVVLFVDDVDVLLITMMMAWMLGTIQPCTSPPPVFSSRSQPSVCMPLSSRKTCVRGRAASRGAEGWVFS
jgi:hypothetical protein